MKVLFDNEKTGGNDKMFDNKVICPTDGDSEDSNSEDVIDIIDIQQIQVKVLPFKTRVVTKITKII